MRKSEPDSKYFVESLGFLSIPCQNQQNTLQNCTTYLLCGFLRNWSVIIFMLCGHKIALCSHRCHFKAIASWKELFKPSMVTGWGVLSARSDLPELLTAGVRAARRCIGFCMEM